MTSEVAGPQVVDSSMRSSMAATEEAAKTITASSSRPSGWTNAAFPSSWMCQVFIRLSVAIDRDSLDRRVRRQGSAQDVGSNRRRADQHGRRPSLATICPADERRLAATLIERAIVTSATFASSSTASSMVLGRRTIHRLRCCVARRDDDDVDVLCRGVCGELVNQMGEEGVPRLVFAGLRACRRFRHKEFGGVAVADVNECRRGVSGVASELCERLPIRGMLRPPGALQAGINEASRRAGRVEHRVGAQHRPR